MGESGVNAARRPVLIGSTIRPSVGDSAPRCRFELGGCVRRLGIDAMRRDAMAGGHTMATAPAAVHRIFLLALLAFDPRCGRYAVGGARC